MPQNVKKDVFQDLSGGAALSQSTETRQVVIGTSPMNFPWTIRIRGAPGARHHNPPLKQGKNGLEPNAARSSNSWLHSHNFS
jgi:hypothetical protein